MLSELRLQLHIPELPSLLLFKHLDSRFGSALCALRIHAGYDPTVDNVVVIPNTFGPNIYTNHVSAILYKDFGNTITYTQRRAMLHAHQLMALSTIEDLT
jgi:hypothetical protein